MADYTAQYANQLKRDLKRVSHTEAFKFLTKRGYSSSSARMPEYYQTSGFEHIQFSPIRWGARTGGMPRITKTLDILTPKGRLSWRSFNYLNPYIFSLLVAEITKEENWNIIVDLLTTETLVHSYSTPVFRLKRSETLSGRGVTNWIQMAEKDILKDSTKFNNLTTTDIKSFYPSVYTHSIAWAVHGRNFMKDPQNRRDYNLLGNRLDKLFQNAHDGQTNGIPIGSMLSDLIAEIILIDIDKKLSLKIQEEELADNVLIVRYRDDYKILSKTVDDGRRVLGYLNFIINAAYDLQLNSDKTATHSDIIEGSFRPWSLEIKSSHLLRKIYYGDLSDCTTASHLKDCLIETYRLQKKYPEGRAAASILGKLADGLYKNIGVLKLNSKQVPELVALLRKVTILREDVTPEVFLLLDLLLKRISKQDEKEFILKAIMTAVSGKNDQSYQLIWFYRLCLSHAPDMCDSILVNTKEGLLRVAGTGQYAYDYEIFPEVDFTPAQKLEMQKFHLINRKKLTDAKGKDIKPIFINPFRY